ncbi:MAG: amidohydrolase [Clostridia bacterium]|nr:amidohydrolase [Clostridia bacterium]
MELLNSAKRMAKELIADRRYLHQNAEVGFALPTTKAYVEKRLREMGYTPKPCGKAGVVAEIGGKSKGCFLLRADMDGLPIRERSGEDFACKAGNMHACGHDMHTAMLLGAAALLKKRQKKLQGRVRLLFQPAEEQLAGAADCIENGVLKGVYGGMMLHVLPAMPFPVGTAVVSAGGVSAPAADFFDVEISGKGCHGSSPWQGVDALMIGARIVDGLQTVSARELSPQNYATLTFGRFAAGVADNVIASHATLGGTLRATSESTREYLKKRLVEMARSTARGLRGRARVVFKSGCPCLVNDEGTSGAVHAIGRQTIGEGRTLLSSQLPQGGVGGSEDFAYIAQKTPCVMVGLCAGELKKGYTEPLHSPRVHFDERAMPYGAALLCAAAEGLAAKNKK